MTTKLFPQRASASEVSSSRRFDTSVKLRTLLHWYRWVPAASAIVVLTQTLGAGTKW